MSTRWKLIFAATLFNVAFEYSLRGLNNLRVLPLLPLLLFPIYFTLFTMVEDLIVRFRLKPYHLMLLSFFYGTVYIALISGSIYISKNPALINVPNMLLINIAWWGTLQAVITFYFANRLSPREADHPTMSCFGWGCCILVQLIMIGIFQKSGLIPHGSPFQRLQVLLILLISFAITALSFIGSNKREVKPFKKTLFMDIIAMSSLCLFLFSAVFLTHDPAKVNTSLVNVFAVKLSFIWALFCSAALPVFRLFSRKEIPI